MTMETREWILENVPNTISKPLGIINSCNHYNYELKVSFEFPSAIVIFVNGEFLFEFPFAIRSSGMESYSMLRSNLFELQKCFTTDFCKIVSFKERDRNGIVK